MHRLGRCAAGLSPGDPCANVVVDVTRVSDSCGFSVPHLELVEDRDLLDRWAGRKTPEQLDGMRRAGLVVGRTLLYPQDGDVAAAVPLAERALALLGDDGRLLATPTGVLSMAEVLPQAFGPDDLEGAQP